ncbi:hypothetical protein CYMTET_9917 [Cymbomonas tetramitiformis]|uniref:Formin-like protein n=1 Tax=Cymbomonas tetramitiformis TaxID=36881 RepID=A0AAE0GQ72_9CHLO|nr:hypothetical protein CYMTET_9917 [Cymbomonas tetramitiformis]
MICLGGACGWGGLAILLQESSTMRKQTLIGAAMASVVSFSRRFSFSGEEADARPGAVVESPMPVPELDEIGTTLSPATGASVEDGLLPVPGHTLISAVMGLLQRRASSAWCSGILWWSGIATARRLPARPAHAERVAELSRTDRPSTCEAGRGAWRGGVDGGEAAKFESPALRSVEDSLDTARLIVNEQFERASAYVDRRRRRKPSPGGTCTPRPGHGREGALVDALTQAVDSWAEYSPEIANVFVSPQNMLTAVVTSSNASTLTTLRECLSVPDSKWLMMFLRLSGTNMLMRVLSQLLDHGVCDTDALQETLSCLRALMNTQAGMESVITTAGGLRRVCMALEVEDEVAAKLATEVLTTLCLFNHAGQKVTLKAVTGMNIWAPEEGSPAAPAAQLSPPAGSQGGGPPPPPPPPGGKLGGPPPPPPPPGGLPGVPPPPPPPPGCSWRATSPTSPLAASRRATSTSPPGGLPGVPPPPPPPPGGLPGVPPPPPSPPGGLPSVPTKPTSETGAKPPPSAPLPPLAAKSAAAHAAKNPSRAAALLNSAQASSQAAAAPPPRIPAKPSAASLGSPATPPVPLGELQGGIKLLRVGRSYCRAIVRLLLTDPEMDLVSYSLAFINAAMNMDVSQEKILKRHMLKEMLDDGLLEAIAQIELSECVDIFLGRELAKFRRAMMLVMEPDVVAPPKAQTPPAPRAMPLPPPPPMFMRPARKIDPGPKPSVKMKQLYWDKVLEIRLDGTVWDCKPPIPKPEWIEWSKVEKLFHAPTRQGGLKAGKKGNVQKVSLLSLKRATQIGILMSRLRVPWQEVAEAVLTLSSVAFTSEEDVETLIKCVPTDDEENILQAHMQTCADAGTDANAALQQLSDAEQFCHHLMQVDRLKPKLSALRHRFKLEMQFGEVATTLQAHQEACQQLRNSELFHGVLASTLHIGNFMNYGTRLGAAGGYMVPVLVKLADCRATGAPSTLAEFILRGVINDFDHLPSLEEESPAIISTSLKTSLPDVETIIEGTESSIMELGKHLATRGPDLRVNIVAEEGMEESESPVTVQLKVDHFGPVMSVVHGDAEEERARLRQELGSATDVFHSLLAHYSEKPDLLSAEGFWTTVENFVNMYSSLFKLMQQEKRAEEEREERRLRQQLQRMKRRATNIPKDFRRGGYGYPTHDTHDHKFTSVERDHAVVDVILEDLVRDISVEAGEKTPMKKVRVSRIAKIKEKSEKAVAEKAEAGKETEDQSGKEQKDGRSALRSKRRSSMF